MILKYTSFLVKNCLACVKYTVHRTVPGRSLKNAGRAPYGARSGIDRCYRHQPAPIRFVTTQGKCVESSLVICKSLISYGGRFIYDHSIAYIG